MTKDEEVDLPEDDDADELPEPDDDDFGPDDADLSGDTDFGDDDDDDDDDEDVEPVPKRRVRARVAAKPAKTWAGVPRAKLEDPKVAATTWAKVHKSRKGAGAKPYSPREKYVTDDVVEHVKFGVGYVVGVPGGTKAEILFEDQLRRLVQGR